MHIALGDGTPLDVLRIDTADGYFDFATCMARWEGGWRVEGTQAGQLLI